MQSITKRIMYTIVESEVFKNKVKEIWEDEERLEFFAYVARDPLCGDIIPGAAGMRKVQKYCT